MARMIRAPRREGVLFVIPRCIFYVPSTTVMRSRRRRRCAGEKVKDLPFTLSFRTGRRRGTRPGREESAYQARLRGHVIKVEKFTFVSKWGWSVRGSTERKEKANSLQLSTTNGAIASPPRIKEKKTKRNEEIKPLMLLPPLTSVAPDCVLEKLHSKKRLHSDASMALATFQEEAVRLVELSSDEKEHDLRRMKGCQRLPRIRRDRAMQTNPAITRGVFPREKMKMLKYK